MSCSRLAAVVLALGGAHAFLAGRCPTRAARPAARVVAAPRMVAAAPESTFDLRSYMVDKLKKVEKEIKDIHRMIAGLEGKERRSQWWVCGYPAGVSDKDIEDFKKNFELCGVDTTETRDDPTLPKQFSSGVAPYR